MCRGEGEGSAEGVDATLMSNTLRYINLTEVDIDLVWLSGLLNLCVFVIKEDGDREGPEGEDSQVLCVCVKEEYRNSRVWTVKLYLYCQIHLDT